LMRPINCVMVGFAVIVGAALTTRDVLSLSWQSLVLGFVTGFTLTAASMAINDYYDRKIDSINEPSRPIPSGLVAPRNALIFAFALTALGFAAALLTNFYSLLVAIFAWIVFTVYTTVGKQTGLFGNFLVSVCVAVPLVYGSFAATEGLETNVLIFALMVFLANTGREITKGIVDVQGDKSNDVRTLAVRFGGKIAAVAAAGFFVGAVLLTPLPWLLGLVSAWFLPLVIVTDLGLLLFSASLLRDHSRDNSRKIKNRVLLWFIFGLLAFIAGSIG
jgi:geranylgeranylglycerol-phosphate geranylgeranyltransferase